MRILLPFINVPAGVDPADFPLAQVCRGLAQRGHEVSVLTSLSAVGASWRRRWEVVLCPNGLLFTELSAWFVGMSKSTPFIYNVQDADRGLTIRAGRLRNRSAIAVLTAWQNFMYRKAAHIVVMTPATRRSLLERRVAVKKISVIPTFVDTDCMEPQPRDNAFAREHGLDGKFVVSYTGDLGYADDLITLLKAAHLLRWNADLLFLIIGSGAAKTQAENKAAGLNLTNVRFIPSQPRESLPSLRASADVHLSLYHQGAANDYFCSTIVEIMASGRPVIAAAEEGSAIDEIISSAQCGMCIIPGDAEDLALAVVQLYRDPALCERMAQAGRWYAAKYHSKQAAIEQYEQLLAQVAGQLVVGRR
jgi:colanic acid biosynthesis glycosyl transferase WcaI